uniref:Uncharacterized protein n=1 Tax=Chromera velia CCMP2878 TaxID=1169474 RepID=A0A0G4H8I2_9ALVE|eukprot:Cvel_25118.t1-p1 / transcript=Cvel_25118.t1 / gene=Cvel_25118 / organism=Chromera_velia_CCMP2878 / gene_product=hypothetical protein / transcript_product=hypothetical protein / location=Cvel_scaffold2803:23483-23886(+) / protein_length=99 / sequence_SO=supercontig / SO=protein_coding / is_pseudo=false
MWNFVAFCVPVGVVLLMMLLSSVSFLERAAQRVSTAKISLGSVAIRFVSLVLILVGCAFAFETHKLVRMNHYRAEHREEMSVEQEDRWKAELWRHHRNW